MQVVNFSVLRVCCGFDRWIACGALVLLLVPLASHSSAQTVLYEAKPTSVYGGLVPSPDGRFFATVNKKILTVWDRNTRKAQEHRWPSLIGPPAFSPDSRLITLGTDDFDPRSSLHSIGAVKVIDVLNKKEVKTLTILQTGKGYVPGPRAQAFSPNGTILAAGSINYTSAGGLITLFDIKSAKIISQFEVAVGAVLSVCFTPDGENLIGGTRGTDTDSALIVWDLKKKKEKHALKGYQVPVSAIACSPRSALMAAGGGHHFGGEPAKDPKLLVSQLLVWDWRTGKRITTLLGHRSAVLALAFAPDGKLLASGDLSGEVRLWDTTTWKEVTRLAAHEKSIDTLSFSPDGKKLRTAGGGKVKAWELRKLSEKKKGRD
jgi:WD40 repeat protein